MSPNEIFGSNQCLCKNGWYPRVVLTVKHGGGVMVLCGWQWFKIQGTVNQHGYHSILQLYAITSDLRLVGLPFVFPPGCVRAISPRRKVMSAASGDLSSPIPWPQPNLNYLGWDWPQSEGKAANKWSACGNSFKTTSLSWLRECQECTKQSRQRVATLKNLKYI